MKKLLPPLLGILLIGAVFYFLLKGNQQKGMHATTSDMTISAVELFADFQQDESAANQKYLNKTVEIKGEISDIKKGRNGMPKLTLAANPAYRTGRHPTFGILCTFDAQSKHPRQEFHLGEEVVLKCICMDYYNNVELTNCVEK